MATADDHRTYSIRQLCREFGATARALRFYEDKGLLTPARKGQTRVYDARDRARLKLILRGRRIGFTLQEIQDMMDLYDQKDHNVHQMAVALVRHRAQIAALRNPRLYARTLRKAWSMRGPGLRAGLYQLFYFLEATVLAQHLKVQGVTHLHNHFAQASGTVALLAARLAGRARETAADQARRLDRAGFALPDGIPFRTVLNDGTPEQGLARFLDALQPVRA